MKKIKIDFFVLGAQKAGTTSLHYWLSEYPNVDLPIIKETHFFSDMDRHQKGVDWYQIQFKNTGENKIIGEIDPEYLFSENAHLKIKKQTTANKFIIILRHPLDRAFSHYQMSVRRGYENLNFTDALLMEKSRINSLGSFALDNYSYIARGMYSQQILRFKNTFPNAEFLFIKFENLISPETQLSTFIELCNFIGIDPLQKSINFNLKYNESSQPKSLYIRNLLFSNNRKFNLTRKIARLFIKNQTSRLKLAMWLDKKNSKTTPSTRHNLIIDPQIQKEVEKDITVTEIITGLNLTDYIDNKANNYTY